MVEHFTLDMNTSFFPAKCNCKKYIYNRGGRQQGHGLKSVAKKIFVIVKKILGSEK